MNIQEITTDALRKMADTEGLVIQGCGGDLREWVDGINRMLTDYGAGWITSRRPGRFASRPTLCKSNRFW